jgi:hypothetical protein
MPTAAVPRAISNSHDPVEIAVLDLAAAADGHARPVVRDGRAELAFAWMIDMPAASPTSMAPAWYRMRVALLPSVGCCGGDPADEPVASWSSAPLLIDPGYLGADTVEVSLPAPAGSYYLSYGIERLDHQSTIVHQDGSTNEPVLDWHGVDRQSIPVRFE